MSYQDVLNYLRPNAVPNEDYIAHEMGFTWIGPGTSPTQDEILAAELPAAKHWRIAANRAECSRRIYARYPAGRQSSVALGIYSGAEAEAQAQIMKDWISDMVATENTAADAIEAAQTVQQVEAVAVTWPA